MNSQRQVTVAGATLTVTVTDRASEVESHESHIRSLRTSNKEKIVVGLDVEWNSTDPSNRVAILEICHGTWCLVVQVPRLDCNPQLLKDFLADGHVAFVELNVTGDASKLRRDYGLACNNAVEIGELAAKVKGDPRLANAGLVKLAYEVLDLEIKKSPDVARYSDFSASVLGDDQIAYAATDAYVSYVIGAELLGGN